MSSAFWGVNLFPANLSFVPRPQNIAAPRNLRNPLATVRMLRQQINTLTCIYQYFFDTVRS